MLKKYHSYLREIGLSDIQIQIYDFIIKNRTGTINEIRGELNFSYSQIIYNLSVLEDMGLIFSSKSKKNKKYFRIDPKIALNRLLNERIEDFKKQIENIDENIKIQESIKGVCLKDINFYHYTDMNLAVNNYYKLINNAKVDIYMTTLPLILIKKLEPVFYNAFLRGVKLCLYFSIRDFDSINNYFDKITDILSRIRITIIQTEERTCQYIRYNDIIVNNGLILIDEKLFNTILFIDDDVFHFDGFYGPNLIQQSKKMLDIKNKLKTVNIEFPEPIQSVLNIINMNNSITTRDLSAQSKIGGGKLREILNFLKNEGKVRETEIKGETGKPKKVYSLIN